MSAEEPWLDYVDPPRGQRPGPTREGYTPPGPEAIPPGYKPPPDAGASRGASPSRYTEIPSYLHSLYDKIETGESKGKNVLYGSKEEVPPGNVIPGAVGPTGKLTHAFSEFQFEPGTWNDANKAAREQGRTLDKDNRADREWAALYIGRRDYKARTGRDLDEDAKAGKLNELALRGTWTSLKPPADEPWSGHVTSAGRWHVSDRAIAEPQGRPDTSVYWVDPRDALDILPPTDDEKEPAGARQRRELDESLADGEDITEIPHFDVQTKGGKLKIIDYDGRHRLQEAVNQGVDLVPISFKELKPGETPKEFEGFRGGVRPFDFTPVPKVTPKATTGEKFLSGVRTSLVEGPTQLATHVLPASVSGAIDRFNNYLADLGAPLGRVPEGGIDEYERQRQSELERSGTAGALPYVAGEVAGTVPLAMAGGAAARGALGAVAEGVPAASQGVNALRGWMQGPGMAPAVTRGAISGAAGAAGAPVTGGDDYWGGKAAQMGSGAALGGALGVAGNVAGSMIAPKILPAAQRLLDRGVRLTPGQLFGGARKATEEVTASVPFSGHAVSAAFRRGIEDFNRVVYDEVLAKIGQKFRGTAIGHDGVDQLERQLSAEYERLKPQIQFRADNGFAADLDNLRVLASEMPRDEARQFAAILKNRVMQRMGRQGVMDGETFKTVESELSQKSRQLHRSEVAGQRDLGKAVDEVNAMLRANLERSSPAVAKELRDLNTAWAAFARVRRAAVSRPASGGVFTPADLLRAEKHAAGERVFARGDGLLQDIARDGQEVLASKVPDSGTARRYGTMAEIGELAAMAMHNPVAAAAQLGAHGAHAALYTAPGLNFLRTLAGAGFPNTRNVLAGLVRRGPPRIAPQLGFQAGALTGQQNGLPPVQR